MFRSLFFEYYISIVTVRSPVKGSPLIGVEDILVNPVWPSRWPYSYEDFRPLDYHRDEPINTGPQYVYSQRQVQQQK